MANRAFLFVSDSDIVNTEESDIKDDVLAEVSYCIPLLWFSLFSLDDIVYSDVEMDNGKGFKQDCCLIRLFIPIQQIKGSVVLKS